MPITSYAAVGGLPDSGGEPLLELLQIRPVDGDPVALHPGDHVDQRQLDVREQRRTGLLLELGVERVGQVGDRAGAQHRVVRGRAALDVVEAELAVVGLLVAQLALEVPHSQVGKIVRPLVRAGR